MCLKWAGYRAGLKPAPTVLFIPSKTLPDAIKSKFLKILSRNFGERQVVFFEFSPERQAVYAE